LRQSGAEAEAEDVLADAALLPEADKEARAAQKKPAGPAREKPPKKPKTSGEQKYT
jgi:hypothetical protein